MDIGLTHITLMIRSSIEEDVGVVIGVSVHVLCCHEVIGSGEDSVGIVTTGGVATGVCSHVVADQLP